MPKKWNLCHEVCIKTVEDHESNVNFGVSNVNPESPPPMFWEYYSLWTNIKPYISWIMKAKSNLLKWKRKQSDHENFSYLFLKELNER